MQFANKSNIDFTQFIALFITIIVFAVATMSPLTGTLGTESATILGLILGPLLFISSASHGSKKDIRGFGYDLRYQGLWAAAIFLIIFVILLINDLRFDNCNPDSGILPFIVLSVPVLSINFISGLWLGRLTGNTKLAIMMAVIFIFIYVMWQYYDWWSHPSLLFFNHYLMVVTGDLFAGQNLNSSIVAFRVATLLFAISLAIAGMIAFPNNSRAGLVSRSGPHSGIIFSLLTVAIAAITINIWASGKLRPVRSELLQEYSILQQDKQIILRASAKLIHPNQQKLIWQQARFWYDNLKHTTGIVPQKPITIWLHSDAKQLKHYTGAKNVHFALPRHYEIHINHSDNFHSTLGHELAHVFFGEKSNTIYGVVGRFGLIPNIGITEGLAVAVTPQLHIDGLTLGQQAAAMKQTDLHPNLHALFSIWPGDFYAISPQKAYIAAGAFIAWLIKDKDDEARQKILSQLANGVSINKIIGKKRSITQVVNKYLDYLQQQKLPAFAKPYAMSLFSSESILSKNCSSTQNSQKNKLFASLVQNNFATVDKQLTDKNIVLDKQMYKELALIAIERGDLGNADKMLMHINKLSKPLNNINKTYALDELADIKWMRGNFKEALALRESIDAKLLPPAMFRYIKAKQIFLNTLLIWHDPIAVQALEYLSVFAKNKKSSLMELASLLGNINQQNRRLETKTSALSRYLLAKYYMNNKAYAPAIKNFERVLQSNLLAAEFIFEAKKQLSTAYYKLGDNKKAQQILASLQTHLNINEAQRYLLQYERSLMAK